MVNLDNKTKLDKAFQLLEEDFRRLEDDFKKLQSVAENVDNLSKNNLRLRGLQEAMEGENLRV